MNKKDNEQFQNIRRQLIKEHLENDDDRLATSDEVLNLQGNITQQLLGDIAFFPVENKNTSGHVLHKSIKKYLISLPKRRIREENPDLDSARMVMQENRQQKKFGSMQKDISYIIQQYKSSLSFSDVITIYFSLAEMYIYDQQPDVGLAILHELQTHESSLDDLQKQKFFFSIGDGYAQLGLLSSNEEYFKKSLVYFNKILRQKIDEETYQKMLFAKSIVCWKLKQYEDGLASIKELMETDFFETEENKLLLHSIIEIQEDIKKKMKK